MGSFALNKRNWRYIVPGMVICIQFLVVSWLNYFEVHLQSWLANVLGVVLFCAPIVTILFLLASDSRFRGFIRIPANILAWFICICCLVGAIVSFEL